MISDTFYIKQIKSSYYIDWSRFSVLCCVIRIIDLKTTRPKDRHNIFMLRVRTELNRQFNQTTYIYSLKTTGRVPFRPQYIWSVVQLQGQLILVDGAIYQAWYENNSRALDNHVVHRSDFKQAVEWIVLKIDIIQLSHIVKEFPAFNCTQISTKVNQFWSHSWAIQTTSL